MFANGEGPDDTMDLVVSAVLEEHHELVARMADTMRRLNEEQLRVVLEIMATKVDADRTLVEATSRMRRAAMVRDEQAFHIARDDSQRALEVCSDYNRALAAAFGDQSKDNERVDAKSRNSLRPMLTPRSSQAPLARTADAQH